MKTKTKAKQQQQQNQIQRKNEREWQRRTIISYTIEMPMSHSLEYFDNKIGSQDKQIRWHEMQIVSTQPGWPVYATATVNITR